jgi:hypothetical protein
MRLKVVLKMLGLIGLFTKEESYEFENLSYEFENLSYEFENLSYELENKLSLIVTFRIILLITSQWDWVNRKRLYVRKE